jgi:hypothetical protein
VDDDRQLKLLVQVKGRHPVAGMTAF